jgi:hypothetical protein
MDGMQAAAVLAELIRDRQAPNGQPRPGYTEQIEALGMAVAALQPGRGAKKIVAPKGQDLLYGFQAIAEHLGITKRQAMHRAAEGQIPTFKMGRAVCASAAQLDDWIAQQGGHRHGQR